MLARSESRLSFGSTPPGRSRRRRAWCQVLGGLPLAVGLLVASLPSPARAQDTAAERFEAARDAYFRRQYEQVIDLLEPVVGGSAADTDQIVVRESRKYLAAAYVLTDRAEDARIQFRRLLESQGDDLHRYRLDAARFPGPVHQVFREVQHALIEARNQARDREAEARAAREAERRAAVEALREIAESPEVDVPNDLALAFVPFGVGQMQNDNPGLGGVFLASELILGAGLIGTLAAWGVLDAQVMPDGLPGGPPAAVLNGLIVANWVLGGVLVLTMGAGIVEAAVSFAPTRRHRQRRQLPPDIRNTLELGVGPGMISATLRF